MSDWNPSLYLHFAAERSRPAVELLARVPLENIEYVADLGCGQDNGHRLVSGDGCRSAQCFAGLPVCGSRYPQLATGTDTRSDFC